MSNKSASPGLAPRGRLLCTAGPDRWAPHVLYGGLVSFVTGQPATPFPRSEPNFLLNARRLGREGFPPGPGQRVSVNGPHPLSWRQGIAERKPGRGNALHRILGEKQYGIWPGVAANSRRHATSGVFFPQEHFPKQPWILRSILHRVGTRDVRETVFGRLPRSARKAARSVFRFLETPVDDLNRVWREG
jgi:hypothetical protein